MDNQFRIWTPKTGYSARKSAQEWEAHKDEVQKMRADGDTLVRILAVLEQHYGFSATVGQLQRRLKHWNSLRQRVNISSAGLHENTNQLQAESTSSTLGLVPTNPNGNNLHDESVTGYDHENRSLGGHAEQSREHNSKCQPRQQNTKSSPKLLPGSSSDPKADLLYGLRQTRADLDGLTNVFKKASSVHFDKSRSVLGEQYSLERQFLKELIQYIREFKHDLLEVVQELEGPANDIDTAACHTSKKYTPTNLEQDAIIQRHKNRSYSELDDGRSDQSSGTIESLRMPSPVLMELAQPRILDQHVTQQQGRCASPGVFLTTGSSTSSLASFHSTHKRVQRCWPFHIDRDEAQNLEPSVFMKGTAVDELDELWTRHENGLIP